MFWKRRKESEKMKMKMKRRKKKKRRRKKRKEEKRKKKKKKSFGYFQIIVFHNQSCPPRTSHFLLLLLFPLLSLSAFKKWKALSAWKSLRLYLK